MSELRKLGEAGNSEAQLDLSNCLYFGWGVPRDLEGSVLWTRKAAEQGETGAQYSLGFDYARGEGVPRDPVEAEKWLRKSAEKNALFASFPLGILYFAGDGVTEDIKAGAEWWQKGAEAGDPDAQYAAGALYENGVVVERDLAKARSFYEKSAGQNYEPAKSALRRVERNENAPANPELAFAINAYNDKNYWPAVSKLLKLADKGLADAQLYLGLAYRDGNFVAQNDKEAFDWVRKAAEQGNVQAEGLLGDFYYAGRGGPADHRAASDWWGKAAAQEDAGAQLKLASLYEIGDGVVKDLDKARALYSGFGAFIYEGQAKSSYARIEGHPYPDELQAAFKAFDDQDYTAAASKAEPFAKKGVAAAQLLLGEVAYHNKDYDAAVDWYRKAAKQDDRDAQFGVGTMGGTHGVSKEEALKGLMRSAEQGFGFAQIALAQHYEQGDGVEKDLAKARSLYEAALTGFPVRAKAGLDRIDAPNLQASIDALHRHDLAAAIDKALPLAKAGNVRAQSVLGSAYLTSQPPNFDAAHEWLSKSAEAGDIDAQFQLAVLYSMGGGSIAANPAEAARWWQTCADRGDGGCAEFLGLAYEVGQGVPKDLQKARALLRQAVVKGVEKAKAELASVEALLEPTGKDSANPAPAPAPAPGPAPAPFGMAEARELGLALRAYAQGDFETALAKGKPLAENGVPAAQKLLGDMYLAGKGGLQPSESEARAWYEKAAAGGNPYAKTALEKLDAKSGSSSPQ